MSRGGRPPKAPGERMTEVLHIRFSLDEADAIYRGAVRAGQSVSEYVRDICRRVGVSVYTKPRDPSAR